MVLLEMKLAAGTSNPVTNQFGPCPSWVNNGPGGHETPRPVYPGTPPTDIARLARLVRFVPTCDIAHRELANQTPR
jgi:hypothetical protein